MRRMQRRDLEHFEAVNHCIEMFCAYMVFAVFFFLLLVCAFFVFI